jgi:hypothetical protein
MSEIRSGECLNCRAKLAGPYCAACGQKAVTPNPTFHDFMHEFTHETLHIDGRIWRSLWLLLSRPGFLTREHCTGRRARYLAPLRLYLIFSILTFATMGLNGPGSTSPTSERNARQGEVVSAGGVRASGRLLNGRTPEQLAERVRQVFRDWLPRLMFALLPVWALLVMMVTRSAHRTFPEHLYFSLHTNAAFFAALTADQLLDATNLKWLDMAGTYLGFGYAVWYGIAAVHTVYGGSWPRAVFRAMTVAVLYTIILLVTIGGMLTLALLL